MNKKTLTALIVSLSMPIGNAFAQEVQLSNNVRKLSLKLGENNILIDESVLENAMMQDLLSNVTLETPLSMSEFRTASIFMRETISTNEVAVIISESTPAQDELLRIINEEKYESLSNINLRGNMIEIQDEDALRILLKKLQDKK